MVAGWMFCKTLGDKTACRTIPQPKFTPSHRPLLQLFCITASKLWSPNSSRYYHWTSALPHKSNSMRKLPLSIKILGMLIFEPRMLLTSKTQAVAWKVSQQLLRRSSCRCDYSFHLSSLPFLWKRDEKKAFITLLCKMHQLYARGWAYLGPIWPVPVVGLV